MVFSPEIFMLPCPELEKSGRLKNAGKNNTLKPPLSPFVALFKVSYLLSETLLVFANKSATLGLHG